MADVNELNRLRDYLITKWGVKECQSEYVQYDQSTRIMLTRDDDVLFFRITDAEAIKHEGSVRDLVDEKIRAILEERG